RLTQNFFDKRGIQVEIVKLNGNIELAPLIGIADVVVDITQTGATLRENKLQVIECVLPSTARFVAQYSAARTDQRVADLVAQLEEMCAGESTTEQKRAAQ
ncbi:MAG: ATP phosphoribosyltransferase, partial [Coriobacteriia bacterium]|nr:ATP phosphoribosyltransferase [Coriobacteriia bacterium]